MINICSPFADWINSVLVLKVQTLGERVDFIILYTVNNKSLSLMPSVMFFLLPFFYKFQTRWRRKIYILIKGRDNVTVMVYQNNNYHMGKAIPWVTLVSFALYLLSYFYYFLCFPWRNVHFIFTDIFKSGGDF